MRKSYFILILVLGIGSFIFNNHLKGKFYNEKTEPYYQQFSLKNIKLNFQSKSLDNSYSLTSPKVLRNSNLEDFMLTSPYLESFSKGLLINIIKAKKGTLDPKMDLFILENTVTLENNENNSFLITSDEMKINSFTNVVSSELPSIIKFEEFYFKSDNFFLESKSKRGLEITLNSTKIYRKVQNKSDVSLGSAKKVSFYPNSGLVILENSVTLNHDNIIITAEQIYYDIREQRILNINQSDLINKT